MLDSQVVAFTAVAALLTITPGADTMLVIRNTLRGGRTFGWFTMLGILSGLLVHAVLSAAGLSVILMKSSTAFHAVKLLGAGYLVWLGIQTIRNARPVSARLAAAAPAADAAPAAAPAAQAARRRVGPGSAFREGMLTNILNPKVALFYLAFLPQFISPGDPVLAKSILLAGIHAVQGMLWLGSIAAVVAHTRTLVARPAAERWIQRISGSVLAALGIRLAFSGRP